MGDETLSIAQKARNNNLAQTEPFGEAPPGETPEEKTVRGRKILRQMRDEDPGVGTLGLDIHMDGQTLSVAQKAREHNLVGFTDQTEPFGEAPPGETPEEKVLRGR